MAKPKTRLLIMTSLYHELPTKHFRMSSKHDKSMVNFIIPILWEVDQVKLRPKQMAERALNPFSEIKLIFLPNHSTAWNSAFQKITIKVQGLVAHICNSSNSGG